MEGHGYDVGDKDKEDPRCPCWDGFPDKEISEEIPVAEHEDDFSGASPGRGT